MLTVKDKPTQSVQGVQESQLHNKKGRIAGKNRRHAGQDFAALFRCRACFSWWGSSRLDVPEKRLLYRLVEPHSTVYLWVDYRGWRQEGNAGLCPECGQEADEADFALSFDEKGEVVWPEGVVLTTSDQEANEDNPFLAYVSQSKKMDQNIAVLAAWEERQHSQEAGYTADIDDLRGEIDKMRTAFKHVVYSYAPLLPPGWRVTGDYDRWLKGQACAGFLHGEINPDASLMIGGRVTTVAELEMELDRLFRYVCEMTC
jgi:hypothetical protein